MFNNKFRAVEKYLSLFAGVFLAGLTSIYAQTLSGNLNGHEYIDLGLPSGTKWATMNVGADSNNILGGYFAWGGRRVLQAAFQYAISQYLLF